MRDLIQRKLEWSRRTFPRQNVQGIIAHLRLELEEVHIAPYDLSERADVALLLMDLWDRGWAQPLDRFPTSPGYLHILPPILESFLGRETYCYSDSIGVKPYRIRGIPGVTHPLNLAFAIRRCFEDLMLEDHVIRMIIETKLAENMQRTWIISEPHEAVRHA